MLRGWTKVCVLQKDMEEDAEGMNKGGCAANGHG